MLRWTLDKIENKEKPINNASTVVIQHTSTQNFLKNINEFYLIQIFINLI